MEFSIQDWISVISFAIASVSALSTFLFKKKINATTEQVNQTAEQIGTTEAIADNLKKLNEIITDVVPNAINTAESSGINNGISKKLYALSIISMECVKRSLDFNQNQGFISDYIDKLIDLTNEVNVNK